jgi:hypothetical protein
VVAPTAVVVAPVGQALQLSAANSSLNSPWGETASQSKDAQRISNEASPSVWHCVMCTRIEASSFSEP